MDDTPHRRFRTLWISDVHLGTHGCRAHDLIAFLRAHDADTVYLVGDVVDGLALRRRWHWAQAHNDVVQKLLRKARKGCRVVYVPGNHDAFARDYEGLSFGGVEILREAFHETADGRRLWVVHGDAFDRLVAHDRWLLPLLDATARALRLLHVPTAWRWTGRLLGRPYRSVASFVRGQANGALAALAAFEARAVEATRRRGAHGIVCGHTHVPALREVDGILYANDGNWVDSCTALVERDDGRLELLRWGRAAREPRRALPADLARAAGLVA